MSQTSTTLLRLCALLALAGSAWCHGYLAAPLSRNGLYNSDWCPHCLAGGGPALVSEGRPFPSGSAGMCGDPASGPRKHEAGGKYAGEQLTARYGEGQVVEVSMVISAFHKGRMGVRVCVIRNYDASNPANEKAQLTEQCLDKNILVQANVPQAQKPGDRWYHFGQTNNGIPCPTGQCLISGTVHTAYYQLPPGLVCDGVTAKCVLQWYWLTGNSCNPPGEPAVWTSPDMFECGSSQSGAYPEEFWNCADIAIMPKGVPFDPITDLHPSLPEDDGSQDASEDPISIIPSYPSDPPPCKPGDQKCVCKWLGRDGFYIETRTNCRRYYVCGPKPMYKLCPANPLNPKQRLRFSLDTNSCGFPKDVSCPKSHEALLAANRLKQCRPSDDPRACAFCTSLSGTSAEGLFADVDRNCEGFFSCSASGRTYSPCSLGLKFNTAGGYCDWAYRVVCPSKVSRAAPTTLKPHVAALGIKAPRLLEANGVRLPSGAGSAGREVPVNAGQAVPVIRQAQAPEPEHKH